MDEEMFMMCCIGKCELVPKIPMDVVKAYNKMHASLNISFYFKVRF
jgi:hypothetical protein